MHDRSPRCPCPGHLYIIIFTKSVDSARLSVDNATLDGRPDWLRTSYTAPRGRFGGSGAPDSYRTGLADLPEDWPAASLRDSAAVTPHESQSREARVSLVDVKDVQIIITKQ